jgi:hypothetical protein
MNFSIRLIKVFECKFMTNANTSTIFYLRVNISYKINHPINHYNNQVKHADKNDTTLIK